MRPDPTNALALAMIAGLCALHANTRTVIPITEKRLRYTTVPPFANGWLSSSCLSGGYRVPLSSSLKHKLPRVANPQVRVCESSIRPD